MRSVSPNNMPWLSNNTSNAAQINRKKNVEHLTHPIFDTLADDTDDPFWKTFLYNCSKGKFPKGFVFNGKTLMYKNGSLQLDIVGNHQATKQLINFVRHNTKMRSKMDLEREKDTQQEIREDTSKTWGEIRSKATKRLLIIDYVITLRSKYSLTEIEVNEVTTLINYYLGSSSVGSIAPYIKISDNSITEITNLNWNGGTGGTNGTGDAGGSTGGTGGGTRKFNFIGVPAPGSSTGRKTKKEVPVVQIITSEQVPQQVPISTLKDWNKFLKDLSKSVSKGDRTAFVVTPIEEVVSQNSTSNVEASSSVSSY